MSTFCRRYTTTIDTRHEKSGNHVEDRAETEPEPKTFTMSPLGARIMAWLSLFVVFVCLDLMQLYPLLSLHRLQPVLLVFEKTLQLSGPAWVCIAMFFTMPLFVAPFLILIL